MAHRRAQLTVFGRQLLVDRIETDGWTIAHAAAAAGVSRQTATKWVRRYRASGREGLEDRPSRPHHSLRALPAERVAGGSRRPWRGAGGQRRVRSRS